MPHRANIAWCVKCYAAI